MLSLYDGRTKLGFWCYRTLNLENTFLENKFHCAKVKKKCKKSDVVRVCSHL